MATLRRNLQQLVHTVQEALAVVESGENYQDAVHDLEAASGLLGHVYRELVRSGFVPGRDAPAPAAAECDLLGCGMEHPHPVHD